MLKQLFTIASRFSASPPWLARHEFFAAPGLRPPPAELRVHPRRRPRLEQHVGADGRCRAGIQERVRPHAEPREARAGRHAVRQLLRPFAALHAVAGRAPHRQEPGAVAHDVRQRRQGRHGGVAQRPRHSAAGFDGTARRARRPSPNCSSAPATPRRTSANGTWAASIRASTVSTRATAPTSNGGPDNVANPHPKQLYGMTERGMDFMARQVKAGKPFYLQLSHYASRQGGDASPEASPR